VCGDWTAPTRVAYSRPRHDTPVVPHWAVGPVYFFFALIFSIFCILFIFGFYFLNLFLFYFTFYLF
jgi:hypothetical protein